MPSVKMFDVPQKKKKILGLNHSTKRDYLSCYACFEQKRFETNPMIPDHNKKVWNHLNLMFLKIH